MSIYTIVLCLEGAWEKVWEKVSEFPGLPAAWDGHYLQEQPGLLFSHNCFSLLFKQTLYLLRPGRSWGLNMVIAIRYVRWTPSRIPRGLLQKEQVWSVSSSVSSWDEVTTCSGRCFCHPPLSCGLQQNTYNAGTLLWTSYTVSKLHKIHLFFFMYYQFLVFHCGDKDGKINSGENLLCQCTWDS